MIEGSLLGGLEERATEEGRVLRVVAADMVERSVVM